jgi:hypothetical protein
VSALPAGRELCVICTRSPMNLLRTACVARRTHTDMARGDDLQGDARLRRKKPVMPMATSTLDADAPARAAIQRDLHDNEAKYVHGVQLLLSEYLNPLKTTKRSLVKEREIDALVQIIADIGAINRRFFGECVGCAIASDAGRRRISAASCRGSTRWHGMLWRCVHSSGK